MGIAPLLPVAPKAGQKKYENGEALKASEQHQYGTQAFGHCRKGSVAAKTATGSQPRTIACKTPEYSPQRLGGVDTAQHQQQKPHQHSYDKGDKNHHNVGDDFVRHRPSVEAHRVVGVRM